MNGLIDAAVLTHPPANDEELEGIADTITDHVVGVVRVVEVPSGQRRSAWPWRRKARRGS